MSESREFYIHDDGIRIHMKLDFPNGIYVEDIPHRNSAYTNDFRIHGAGKLPLMILIHGFTGHMEERHIIAAKQAALDVGCAVLRAEMYGHGLSGGNFRDHTLFKWMSNAMAVIDYARTLDFVSEMYMCGHSQGGLLTILVGAMERDILNGLLELSPAAMIPETARRGEILGIHFDPNNISREVADRESLPLNENYIRVAQIIKVDIAIAAYTRPVLIVHGTADDTVPFWCSEELARRYANARLVPVHGDTHCYDYHLDQMTRAIRDFLREVSSARGY